MIINDVRGVITAHNKKQMHKKEIWDKLMKIEAGSRYNQNNITFDNYLETLHEYMKMSVVYVDKDDHVMFL